MLIRIPVVASLILGPWCLGLAGQAQTPPAASAASPAPLPAPVMPAGSDVWRVDPSHTSAQFAVRHLLVSTVRGRLGVVTGWVKYDPKAVATTAAEVWIDATGINSGSPARDADLRSDNFLLVDQHPRIVFRSTRAEPRVAGTFRLTGDLTIRGVTREVVLDVEAPSAPIQRGAGQPWVIGTSATTTISRRDFGLKYSAAIEAGGAVVGDDVRITLDIEVRRPASSGGRP